MEIGGLMAYAFKVFLGNPDIMAALITWAIITTLVLTVIEIFKETNL
ncbi:hypothetical protein [Peribacillus sp. TH24]|nr:hypothetical protein [Peribacillus sp. TH24]MBK5447035.1 hypothetical protein [Peribacillus sp. TH24]MBK5447066.1 hypothetical protein [Peribacillus sp. TH24]